MKRLLALGVAGLVASGVLAAGAGASTTTTSVFLCYSHYQVDPGVWPTVKVSPQTHQTAADLLAAGYWSPYAETSVPTQTAIGNGYYLICNLPSGLSPVHGMLVGRKGGLIPMSPKLVGEPGLYPEAA